MFIEEIRKCFIIQKRKSITFYYISQIIFHKMLNQGGRGKIFHCYKWVFEKCFDVNEHE